MLGPGNARNTRLPTPSEGFGTLKASHTGHVHLKSRTSLIQPMQNRTEQANPPVEKQQRCYCSSEEASSGTESDGEASLPHSLSTKECRYSTPPSTSMASCTTKQAKAVPKTLTAPQGKASRRDWSLSSSRVRRMQWGLQGRRHPKYRRSYCCDCASLSGIY